MKIVAVLVGLVTACGGGGTSKSIDRLATEVHESTQAVNALAARVATLEQEIHKQSGVHAGRDGGVGTAAKLAPFGIASEPPGATVSVDGREVGVTPLTITPPAALFHVDVRKAGFLPISQDVDLAIEGASVAFALKKE